MCHSYPFSEKTQRFLTRAGWFPGRCIDTSEFEQVLISMNSTFYPCVKKFFSQFGDLEIMYSVFPTSEIVCLGFITASFGMFEEENIHDVEKIVDKQLCLIGVIEEFETMMLMDAEGKVYISDLHPTAFVIGNSGEEAIDNHFSSGLVL